MGSPYILKKGVSGLEDLLNGMAAASLLAHGGGREFFWDPTHGNDGNDGRSPAKAVKTLPIGYGKLRDGYHDILYYIAGSSSASLTAQLEWAKSYAHLIGICAPVRAAQRARIFLSSEADDISPMIKVSGSGNVVANLYAFSGIDDAGSLIDVQVTGDRNFFENVHFAGAGHATCAIDGAASLNLVGADENVFKGCTIGLDTVAAAAGVTGLLYSGSASARNTFEDCLFNMYAGEATASFIEMTGQNTIDRFQLFRRCQFLNLATQAMTYAIVIEGGNNGNSKRFLLEDCASVGAGDWSSIASMVYLNNGAITGGTTAGQYVVNS